VIWCLPSALIAAWLSETWSFNLCCSVNTGCKQEYLIIHRHKAMTVPADTKRCCPEGVQAKLRITLTLTLDRNWLVSLTSGRPYSREMLSVLNGRTRGWLSLSHVLCIMVRGKCEVIIISCCCCSTLKVIRQPHTVNTETQYSPPCNTASFVTFA
jgi:hypothetical protein